MDAAHEIFRRPYPVDLTLEEADTPPSYRNWPGGEDLPAKLQVWRVHGALPQKDFGIVSDGYGFTDTPDCEFIASGLNTKGPRSVAIGRQGNWFLWGFCAPPSAMTEPARRAFCNAVVYMKRFEGQRPLTQKVAQGREWALFHASLLERNVTGLFDEDLMQRSGGKAARMREILRAELPWLYRTEGPWHVDADAKAFGFGNADPRLLQRCLEALEAGAAREEAPAARRVLERYTGQRFATAAEWAEWVAANRERLYFSDTAGYRWLVRE